MTQAFRLAAHLLLPQEEPHLFSGLRREVKGSLQHLTGSAAIFYLSINKVPGTITGRTHFDSEQMLRRSHAGKSAGSGSNVTVYWRTYAQHRYRNAHRRR
jgi:hypothetical protein